MRYESRRNLLLGLSVLALALLWTGFEVLAEEGEATSVFEFILDTLEKGLLIIGAGGVFLLVKNSAEQQREHTKLLEQLEVARIEGENWRRSAQNYLTGVGEEIEKQFQTWGLSDAEREVALFMIKGLSHKEIAELLNISEGTSKWHVSYARKKLQEMMQRAANSSRVI